MGKKSRAKRFTRSYNTAGAPLKIAGPAITLRGTIVFLLFIIGMLLIAFQIHIYHKTLIDWKIPAGICVITGLIVSQVSAKWLAKEDLSVWYWRLLFSMASFGGIATYTFMALNFYVATDKETTVVKTEIIKTGHLAKGKNGCGNPYVNVYINGFDKQIIFGCDDNVEGYNFATLTLRKGALGFDVVIDKKLSVN